MKQFIWMLCGIFVSGLLVGTLSACGAEQYSVCTITAEKPSAAQEESPALGEPPESGAEEPLEEPPAPSPKPGASITAEEDQARMLAYGKALWDMYLLGLRPDGEELERATDLGPAEGNRFAIADVNGGGAEPLEIPYRPLEEVNIAALGCPRPEVTYPEPVG